MTGIQLSQHDNIYKGINEGFCTLATYAIEQA